MKQAVTGASRSSPIKSGNESKPGVAKSQRVAEPEFGTNTDRVGECMLVIGAINVEAIRLGLKKDFVETPLFFIIDSVVLLAIIGQCDS